MLTMASCDKWDCNGDLDGMWQLMEWRDKDDVVKAIKQDMIFFCGFFGFMPCILYFALCFFAGLWYNV